MSLRIARLSRKKNSTFETLNEMVMSLADVFAPPERLTVSEAAERYVHINVPGAYIGPYRNDTVPYMVEPMNTLISPDYTGCVFVGPAQSGKTQSLLLNWLAYNIMVDPMDMIFYCPSQAAARDFAVRRVDRLHRHSPEIGKMLSASSATDTMRDKHYRNGTILTLSWPSVTELAGRPIGRVAITDRDRMEDDIDGEGEPFDLASKRTTTFMSFAMTLAESSPSRPVTDPRWMPRTPHEAPPTTGILALYNRGDRRRFYWPCPRCNHFFEGNFRMLKWEPHANRMDAADSVRMICPKCGYAIEPDHRKEMMRWGVWVKDGQTVDENGLLHGKGERSNIASFWLNGVAATFVTWQQLVATCIAATDEFEKTASEDALRKFYNNDLAEPYIPKRQEAVRTPETLQDRASPVPSEQVPPEVRFLVAAVDVQKNMFVVQVFGIAPGEPFDVYVIDRFDIRKSERVDDDDERLWVKPGTYLSDWNLLTEHVIKRTYPLMSDPESRMPIRMTVCDSGGKEGVTMNAYAYYRVLRREGLASRFHLVKGEKSPRAPRTSVRYPDNSSRASGPKAGAQGDVPVLFLQSDAFKDALDNRLEATEPGKGMIHIPDTMPDWFFQEMCSEVRTAKGWEPARGGRARNEAWDLTYYCLGVCASSVLNIEKIKWDGNLPDWLLEQDRNPHILRPNRAGVAQPGVKRYDLRQLGKALG
jgi:phage terminase large subunit GpA-like protein